MSRTIAYGILVAIMTIAAPSRGQTLNMDMGWALNSQAGCWNHGVAAAQQARDDYLRNVWQYRARTGYTGPMPSPVSQESLQASIRGMNDAFADYNRSWYANSAALGNAASNYANHAILGQGGFENPATGTTYTLADGWSHRWVDAGGNLAATNDGSAPAFGWNWTQLRSTW